MPGARPSWPPRGNIEPGRPGWPRSGHVYRRSYDETVPLAAWTACDVESSVGSFSDTTVLTPTVSIEMPYSACADSIVARLCETTTNWVRSLSSRNTEVNRRTF